jgi:hypothetical protein
MNKSIKKGFAIGLIVMIALIGKASFAQVDSTQVAQPATATVQTEQAAVPETTVQEKSKKEDKKRRDEFIPYVGVNFNQISDLETDMGIGYHLGFNYKRGKFFYWQVGAQFNNSVYRFTEETGFDTTGSIGVRNINVPITGGINFLSFTNRILALRIFVSAVPGFVVGVGENDFDITKDYLESFIMYGQGGIGVDVAFLVLEAGYNYGFTNVLTTTDSKPGQIFVNLGFRF